MPLQFLCAKATQRQSTTVNCAIRLAVAPLRNVVSRAEVNKTMSATVVAGLRNALVIKIIVTPRFLNSCITSTVSTVIPLWLIATSASPGPRSESEVKALWLSRQAIALLPWRFNLSCKSIATNPPAATPNSPIVFAFSQASTAAEKLATSNLCAVA